MWFSRFHMQFMKYLIYFIAHFITQITQSEFSLQKIHHSWKKKRQNVLLLLLHNSTNSLNCGYLFTLQSLMSPSDFCVQSEKRPSRYAGNVSQCNIYEAFIPTSILKMLIALKMAIIHPDPPLFSGSLYSIKKQLL